MSLRFLLLLTRVLFLGLTLAAGALSLEPSSAGDSVLKTTGAN